MIKKYIFYNQIKNENFYKFIIGYLLKTISVKILFSYFGNII